MKKQLNRRTFIEKSAVGLAATGFMATTSCASSETTGLGKSFVHHVYFWLKQPVTQEAKSKFEAALKELATIETIVDHHLGVPAPTNREVIDSSYSYSMLTLYKNKEDQDIYQTHPKHLKFIEDCQDLWEKVLVYDTVSI
jgi:hypothetical protein